MNQTIKELAEDYSDYLRIDTQIEISQAEEIIEDMLIRLEEFESLMDGVHIGGTNSLVQSIPKVQDSCQALEGLFGRIDHIETLVNRVRKDLNAIEATLDTAEVETAPQTPELGLRSFLKPLFSKKNEAQLPGTSLKSPTFEPPEIFRAKEYFPASIDQQKEKDTL